MAGIERYHARPILVTVDEAGRAPGGRLASPAEARQVAAELARLGAAVEVTTTRHTVRVDSTPRAATVRRLPRRSTPVRHRPRAGKVAVVAGSVVTGTAASGFTLGALGVGLSAVEAMAAAAGAAVLILPAAALLARRTCPGAHCGGCK